MSDDRPEGTLEETQKSAEEARPQAQELTTRPPALPDRARRSAFALSDVPGRGADRPPEERGTLVVRERALEHLACSAANSVPDTLTRPRGIPGIGGRPFPSASVRRLGGRAWIEVDVAAAWPCSAADLAREVRSRVFEESARMSGVRVEAVDVTLHLVDPGEIAPETVRRVE